MKNHAIIPIFIPHLGCSFDCVFCNQRKITAREEAPGEADVRKTVETWLSTLGNSTLTNPNLKVYNRPDTLEIAFYGGSFTGIPLHQQRMYLGIAREYKEAGRIDKIHLSTRPDYVNSEIISLLKEYTVDVVELGCQSFDDSVLAASKRGHDSKAIYAACKMIKDAGMELGIQLMIGLPGDSRESCIASAMEAVKLAPSLARLYPTVVIKDTELYDMYQAGAFTPLPMEEAIYRTKEMYKILWDADITIMRVGLKSSDIIYDGEGSAALAGTYHPAFRQLVESEIAKERIEALLTRLPADSLTASTLNDRRNQKGSLPGITVASSPSWFSNMVGQHNANRHYFQSAYPDLRFNFAVSEKLAPGEFSVTLS